MPFALKDIQFWHHPDFFQVQNCPIGCTLTTATTSTMHFNAIFPPLPQRAIYRGISCGCNASLTLSALPVKFCGKRIRAHSMMNPFCVMRLHATRMIGFYGSDVLRFLPLFVQIGRIWVVCLRVYLCAGAGVGVWGFLSAFQRSEFYCCHETAIHVTDFNIRLFDRLMRKTTLLPRLVAATFVGPVLCRRLISGDG